jgi:hypothetical protein
LSVLVVLKVSPLHLTGKTFIPPSASNILCVF